MNLFIVGLGIKCLSHVTKETEEVIKKSDKILHLTNDPVFDEYLYSLNSNSESLVDLYFSNSDRKKTYKAINAKVNQELNEHKNLCLVLYGHPTYFAQLSEDLEQHANCKVKILPAVSSLDCMLADLNVNPGRGGMKISDATEFLITMRAPELCEHLVLYQIAAVALKGHLENENRAQKGFIFLCNYLKKFYPDNTPVILYEASQRPGRKPRIIKIQLVNAHKTIISSLTTLYIAPQKKSLINISMQDTLINFFRDFDTAS